MIARGRPPGGRSAPTPSAPLRERGGWRSREPGWRRLLLSLLLLACALSLAFLPPAPGANAADVLDPDGSIFPALSGAIPIRVEGEISVNGRRLSTSILRVEATPREVIAFYRRHFEAQPVDLAENQFGDGIALAIWDIRRGRELTIVATRTSAGTEVIRSWTKLSPVAADRSLPAPALPRDLLVFSEVEDRSGDASVITWSAASERSEEALLPELIAGLLEEGWVGGEVDIPVGPDAGLGPGAEVIADAAVGPGAGVGPDVGGGPSVEAGTRLRRLHFRRRGQQLLVTMGEAPEMGTIATLRLDSHVPD